MKVILVSDLRHGGKRGEVIDVKPGYARNFLLPKGLAVAATHANVKWFEQQRAKIDVRLAQERDAAAVAASGIAGTQVTIAKRAGESETLYGSVTAAEVVEALAAKGIDVDRRQVDLAGGIKTVGEHIVRIELHSDVVAEITVIVLPEA